MNAVTIYFAKLDGQHLIEILILIMYLIIMFQYFPLASVFNFLFKTILTTIFKLNNSSAHTN